MPKKRSLALFIKQQPSASIILLLIISVLIVYLPVFSHQFQMKWDDQWVVINFYTENGLTSLNLSQIFTNFYHGQYAPLNQLSYTLVYAAVGYDPFWFHTLGIVLHICNVLLVYTMIKGLLAMNKEFSPASQLRISAITTIIMAVHPFLVESVAWLSASKILIYAFFYLIALNLYLKYLAALKWKYFLLMVIAFICSFGGKEQAVTLPVCLLLIDYTLNRNLKDKRIWIEKIPLLILSLFFGYVTMASQLANGVGVLSKEVGYPFYQNLLFASYSLIEYLVKCLIPINLSYLYPFPNEIGTPVPLRFWIYPVLILCIGAFLWDLRKRKWIIFGSLFFIIHLGLTIHILPIARFAIVADRYVYISAIGIFFLIAYFLDQLLGSVKYKKPVAIGLGIYLLALAGYTYQHTKVWQDSDTLKIELKEWLNKRNEFENKKNDSN